MHIAHAGLAGPAAMVHRQAIVRRVITIQVDQHIHAVVIVQSGIARSRARRGGILRTSGLAAADRHEEKLVVAREHRRRRPGPVIVLRARQLQAFGLPPHVIIQLPVQLRPGGN